jgi:hypothetical protein
MLARATRRAGSLAQQHLQQHLAAPSSSFPSPFLVLAILDHLHDLAALPSEVGLVAEERVRVPAAAAAAAEHVLKDIFILPQTRRVGRVKQMLEPGDQI